MHTQTIEALPKGCVLEKVFGSVSTEFMCQDAYNDMPLNDIMRNELIKIVEQNFKDANAIIGTRTCHLAVDMSLSFCSKDQKHFANMEGTAVKISGTGIDGLS